MGLGTPIKSGCFGPICTPFSRDMYPIFEGYVPHFRGICTPFSRICTPFSRDMYPIFEDMYPIFEDMYQHFGEYVPIKKTRVLAFPCLTFRVHIIYTKFAKIKYSRKDSMKDSRKDSMKNSKKGDYMYHTIILWVHIVSKE